MGESPDTLEQLLFKHGAGSRWQVGVAAKSRPRVAAATQDVAQLQARLIEESRQVLVAVRLELGHDLLPAIGDLRADVLQHQSLRLLVEDYLRPGREEREALLDLVDEVSPRGPRECAIAACELEL